MSCQVKVGSQSRSTKSSPQETIARQSQSSGTKSPLPTWRCDFCKEAYFHDYDEACRHEEQCRQRKPLHPRPATVENSEAPSGTPTVDKKEAKTAPDVSKPVRTTSKTTSTSNKRKPASKTVAAHSFFAPRTAASKKSKTDEDASSQASKQSQASHPFFSQQSTKQNQAPYAHSDIARAITLSLEDTKSADTKKSKKAAPVTLATAEATANALAAMIDSQVNQPLAGIFAKPTKQLVAEQRQAEFQAKLRLERQREQERQSRKRQETAAPRPTKTRTAPQSQLPLAPRFPTPCVVPSDLNVKLSISAESASFWMEIPSHATPRPTTKGDSNEASGATTIASLVPSPSALDSTVETRDLLLEAFRNLLVPPSRQCNNSQSSQQSKHESRMWIDKYGLHNNGLVGEQAQTVAQSLQRWIQDWCRDRQQAMERMKERQRKLAKRRLSKAKSTRKVAYKNDSEEDELWEDDLTLSNVYLLTGPPASGKTSMVHYVARTCHCPVLEINTTTCRSASALKHAIQEATQSCSSLDLFQQQQNKTLQNAWDDDSDEDEKEEPQASSLTVILIDEVDLIYESQGDAGFWQGLAALAKTARCPILLTSNTVPPGMLNIRHQHLELQLPTPSECATKLLQVCQHEGVSFSKTANQDPSMIQERLSGIAQICQCDLRHLLLELQLFVSSHDGKESTAQQDAAQLSPTTSEASETDPLPKLISVTPRQVPADKYSVLTVNGRNLSRLRATERHKVEVRIGDQTCPAYIADNDSLRVLCPPCANQALSSRMAPLSIHDSPYGTVGGVDTETIELADGNILQGTRHLVVEYKLPDDEEKIEPKDPMVEDDIEEFEFDEKVGKTSAMGSQESAPFEVESAQQGMDLWKATLNELQASQPSADTQQSSNQAPSMVLTLEELAEDLKWGSDAALLEDLQCGLPYLSGVCPGFGFDLTEEDGGVGSAGKLRKNDNCRPPNEDRLYSLGWKDTHYFYGNSDTYMTLPGTASERRELNECMLHSRGQNAFGIPSGLTDKEEIPDDSEAMIRTDNVASEEDMFLPRPLPSLVESLPMLLRQCRRNGTSYSQYWSNNQMLDQRRATKALEMRTLTSHVFQDTFQPGRVSSRQPTRELLLLDGQQDSMIRTEFLPALGWISTVERSSEWAERQGGESNQSTTRRTTRRQARAARRHFLDGISRRLQRDEGDMTTSQVGNALAKQLLTGTTI